MPHVVYVRGRRVCLRTDDIVVALHDDALAPLVGHSKWIFRLADGSPHRWNLERLTSVMRIMHLRRKCDEEQRRPIL